MRPPAPGLFSTTTVAPVFCWNFLRDQPREDVVAAAGGKADDETDGAVRISVLARMPAGRGQQPTAAKRQANKLRIFIIILPRPVSIGQR